MQDATQYHAISRRMHSDRRKEGHTVWVVSSINFIGVLIPNFDWSEDGQWTKVMADSDSVLFVFDEGREISGCIKMVSGILRMILEKLESRKRILYSCA